jgi:hypothetical protein
MNMKKLLLNVSLVIGLLLAFSVSSASASDEDNVRFRARLNGAVEIPSTVATGASGNFEARVEGNSLIYKLSYSGLEGGNTLAAHIHIGSRRTAGGVMAFLCGNNPVGTPRPPCPNVSGTVEGTITSGDIIGLTAQQINAGDFNEFIQVMRTGIAYVNVHTTASPAGEIRGQVRTDEGRHRGRDDDERDH